MFCSTLNYLTCSSYRYGKYRHLGSTDIFHMGNSCNQKNMRPLKASENFFQKVWFHKPFCVPMIIIRDIIDTCTGLVFIFYYYLLFNGSRQRIGCSHYELVLCYCIHIYSQILFYLVSNTMMGYMQQQVFICPHFIADGKTYMD